MMSFPRRHQTPQKPTVAAMATISAPLRRRIAIGAVVFSYIIFVDFSHENGSKSRSFNHPFIFLDGAHIPPLQEVAGQLKGTNAGDTENQSELQPVNSAPGVTGPGIPFAMKQILDETGVNIEEDASTIYAAEKAVDFLEAAYEWIPEETNFRDKSCFVGVGFEENRKQYFADPSVMDIVTPSIRNLDFLEEWREFFQGFHIIIIQDGDPGKHLEIPEWVDYELYNRDDIKMALGEDEWIISSKDASIRNFGFLISKKPFIYTIDDDCLPAKDSKGNIVNPLAFHLRNLQTPSHPYFFNTLYDPYASNSDFVRGYPYSLRGGVPTAISHGLWLFTPDYDAPTQLLKPTERNNNHLDMAITVPHRTLYPMCSMNVAFARELIGPAFMQGLMGEGQPWGRYDDMFAGWASKVVADHLGVGVKSGTPYIYRNKLSNPFMNLKKEYKGLEWQEEMIRFFADDVKLSKESNTPLKAYVELANLITRRFASTNPYFQRLGDSMVKWTKIWHEVSMGSIKPVPSRMSNFSVPLMYPPINLHLTSVEKTLPAEEILSIFPIIGRNARRSVNVHDVIVGHQWKTYILPLDKIYHEKQYERIIKGEHELDCFLKSCNAETIRKGGPQYTDHLSEIIILRKLLGSLHFISNLKNADLVLVPALGVASIIGKCRNYGRCWDDTAKDLEKLVVENSDVTKKHLFLATQDSSQNHPFFRKQHSMGNVVVTLGPGGLVVPSLNPKSDMQPENWKGCKPLDERNTFLLANFGVRGRLKDRITINGILDHYSGHKKVTRIVPSGVEDALMDSVMTLCPPGDLPFTKRFFDMLLQCSIPVVIKRTINSKGVMDPNGMDETYWSNVDYENNASPKIMDSYPQLDFPYSDIVVEFDADALEFKNMMEYLESLPRDVLQKKFNKIQDIRTRFLYDFSGNVHDAFSVMLDSLWEKHLSSDIAL